MGRRFSFQRLIGIIFILTMAGFFNPAIAIDYPQPQSLYVNDFADILSDDEEERITQTLEELRASTGVEFTLLTIDSLQDYDHYGGIEPYATRLFNNWGIGDAELNNGILFLVAVSDRKLRIEVGSGYGRELDQPLKILINSKILPKFKTGDFPAGIEAGVLGTIQILNTPLTNQPSPPSQVNAQILIWIVSAFVLVIFSSVFFMVIFMSGAHRYLSYYGKKMRSHFAPKCQYCSGATRPATGKEARTSLTPGQQHEHQLGSTDYKVWICQTCGEATIHMNHHPRPKGSECPECHFTTMITSSKTTRKATERRSGKKEVHSECENCGYYQDNVAVIPKVSGTSSSDSSDFGGGSSSGGGASGSW